MIPVTLPAPPAHYQASVQQPGLAFLSRTANPTKKDWKRHQYWQNVHNDLYSWHKGICVYCASWTPRRGHGRVDHTSIDHYIPKSVNRQLAYEWSNFRMVRSKLNIRKESFQDVLDPCNLQPGCFRLNFTTFLLEPASALAAPLQLQVTSTIARLLLNQDPAYVNERARVVYRYSAGKMTMAHVQRFYPFVAFEMQSQNFDVAFKPAVAAAVARRPSLAN